MLVCPRRGEAFDIAGGGRCGCPVVALPYYGYLASIMTIPRNETVAVPSLAIIDFVGRLPTLPLYDSY